MKSEGPEAFEIVVGDSTLCVVVHEDERAKIGRYRFEVPSARVYSAPHAAKAVEVALRASASGRSLRSLELEVLRRLAVVERVNELLHLLEEVGASEKCIIDVYDLCPPPGELLLRAECSPSSEAPVAKKTPPKIVEMRKKRESLENAILSRVELSLLDLWK
ncbi:MAG: hypothetical protein QW405_02975 [Fervidicoccaceae archaeon]